MTHTAEPTPIRKAISRIPRISKTSFDFIGPLGE
jgi:hypothetical protein